MNPNLYWSVYKSLEREFISLSNIIYINDEQLKIYSIKITELLIRAVVEVESISKELYFANRGPKEDDNELFFDTDCLNLLEQRWSLSKKEVLVSSSNLYFDLEENNILTPLKKANKRGSSSSDWLKAFQAVKHNRAKNLKRGNLRNLIRALAGLYILNLYFKDTLFSLGNDGTGTNFDASLGSEIFSVRLHINPGISIDTNYIKNSDFDKSIYLLKATDKTRQDVQNSLKEINDKTNERLNANLTTEIQQHLKNIQVSNEDDIKEYLKKVVDKIKSKYQIQVAQENGHNLKKTFESLQYEGILNKQQY